MCILVYNFVYKLGSLVQVKFFHRHEMEATNSTLQLCYIWFIFCELMCRFDLCLLKLVSDAFVGTEWNGQRTVTWQNPRQWNIITPPISVSTRVFCSHLWNFQNHKKSVSPHHATGIVSTFLINTFLVQLYVMVCQCVCLYLIFSGHVYLSPAPPWSSL